MERQFEYGGRKYQLSKVNAFKQFHIVRRLSPILGDLVAVAPEMQKAKADGENANVEQLSKIAAPIMNGLSKLSDQDSEYVLFGLLNAVEVQQEPAGNWAKVCIDKNLMIQNLDLPTMMNLAGRAFMFNLESFFSALPAQQ